MVIAPGSKIVFMGDSITDSGHDPEGEPTPWHREGGLGSGYVNYIYAILTATRPQDKFRVINHGHSGWTVRDLERVWQEQALALKPDWISIMIGINDVWRQFDSPLKTELHVSIEEYEATLERLITASKPRVQGLILVTPYLIETNLHDAWRIQSDRYLDVVRRLAMKHQTLFVNTQSAFDRILRHRHPTELSWDRIHGDSVGHMIVARAWLHAVGFTS